MKIKIKNIDKCCRLFEIEIPAEIVKRATEEVYKDIKSKAKIPGFRPGAAPKDILEKHYGKTAEQEVLSKVIPEGYRKALEQYKINPVSLPEFSGVEMGKDKELKFKAKVEVRPEIKPKNYKGIRVNRKKIALNQDEVNEGLKRIQEMSAQFIPIEPKGPVKKGDYTVCDVEAFIDGKPISKKHNNMWIMADKDASMLGLGEHLIGANPEDTKEILTRLPENYPDKKFTNKEAKFKIHIKEVKERKLPLLDDALAKDMGLETLENLKENLSTQMLERKEATSAINMKNQILDKLLQDYKFDVPPSITKRQLDILVKQAEEELLSKGINKETIESKKKELEPRLKNDAINKIKVYFILDEISRIENIKLTDDDIAKKFESIARASNQDVGTVKEYYEKNDLMGGLEEQLKEEKTLNWLLSVANVEQEK
ncbi:MAG: trigger factor [Candidatus Omnitrophica bacterium]|nr:trigger factor [Candidatus Omnitrophota bacterium]